MTRTLFVVFALLLTSLAHAQAPADTSIRVAFAGFVDAYYAYDFGEPVTFDRSFVTGAPFTTQPARHNEFNVNLAFIEAVVTSARVRGRLALQAGTSVQANYAGEPSVGGVSGPTLTRHLQEAYAGIRVTPRLWVDGGIFFSHMGMESWISRDNLTYTRSLVAEYSPYFSTGVRATWVSGALTARVDVVNGWANVSETNEDKGLGLRFDLAATPTTTLTYFGFLNSEDGGRRRLLNGVGIALAPSPRVSVLGQFDYGSIENVNEALDNSTWYGFTAMGRVRLSPTLALAARVERYDDEDQVNIVTGLPSPFQANGLSLTFDVAPAPRILWRSELRGFFADDAIFSEADTPGARSDQNVLLVTSLAVTF